MPKPCPGSTCVVVHVPRFVHCESAACSSTYARVLSSPYRSQGGTSAKQQCRRVERWYVVVGNHVHPSDTSSGSPLTTGRGGADSAVTTRSGKKRARRMRSTRDGPRWSSAFEPPRKIQYCCDRLLNRSTRCAQARRLAAHILEVLRVSQISVVSETSPCPGTTISGLEAISSSRTPSHLLPLTSVSRGGKYGKMAKHACLQQVTSEQHAIVDEDGLVAGTMRWTHAAQHGSVSRRGRSPPGRRR